MEHRLFRNLECRSGRLIAASIKITVKAREVAR